MIHQYATTVEYRTIMSGLGGLVNADRTEADNTDGGIFFAGDEEGDGSSYEFPFL
jgi:hypothetical protein